MQPMTDKRNSSDWATVAICLVVSLTAALVMAHGSYFISQFAHLIFDNPSSQKLAGIGVGAIWWSGFYTICLSISLCVSIFKSWLRWPIFLGATLVAGVYPSFLNGTGYVAWQISALATVSISFVLLLVTQCLLGNISAGLPKPKISSQIPLSDLFSLTFICSAVTLALVCMRPSDFSMPILINLFIFIGVATCVSLPVPIAAYITFSDLRRKYALLSIIFLLPALATTLYVWADLQFALTFILSQLALGILLTALRFRGIRIIPADNKGLHTEHSFGRV